MRIMESMTMTQAKEYFISKQCSHFAMGREDSDKYREYLLLQISRKTEKIWREERLNSIFQNILTPPKGVSLWEIYFDMANLVENINTLQSLEIMGKAIEIIKEKLKLKDRVIIADIIIGDDDISRRKGLIFQSYRLKNKDLACSFAKEALILLEIETTNSELERRAEEAKKTCKKIIEKLKLNC